MYYLALYELSECHHACPTCGTGIVDKRQKFCSRECARGRRPDVEYVYFIESVELPGRYKIGYTADLDRRYRGLELQNAGGIALRAYFCTPSGRRSEARIHSRFGHLRGHGEWFVDAGGELLAYINGMCNGSVLI